MKIGIDIDEILTDLVSPLVEYHNMKYGTKLKKPEFKSFDFWKTWGGTQQEAVKKVNDFFKTEYFKNMKPLKGAVEGVSLLARKNELFAITSRPVLIQKETKSWIAKYFSDKFQEVCFSNNTSHPNNQPTKMEICQNLGIKLLIEDHLGFAEDVAEKGIRVLLMNAPWNQKNKLPKNMTRVYSWQEIIKILS